MSINASILCLLFEKINLVLSQKVPKGYMSYHDWEMTILPCYCFDMTCKWHKKIRMMKIKVKTNFTCLLKCSSLELLNVRQYLRIIVYMILAFLLETLNLLTVFLVVPILVVLKLMLLVRLKVILAVLVAFRSPLNLFVLVVVAGWMLVQVLCHWVLHFQVVLETLSRCVLVKSIVNAVWVAQRRRLVIVCVQRCLCS